MGKVETTDVDVVRRALDAWNARDIDAAETLAHPEIEWEVSGYLLADRGKVVRGREQFVQFGTLVFDTFAESVLEVDELTVAGPGMVVGSGGALFRGVPDGAAVTARWVRLFQIRDGMIWRSTIHATRESALAAAGVER